MKQRWYVALAICGVLLSATAMAARVIDNFEDGNISANPEWWKFGRMIADVAAVAGKAPKGETLGKKALSIEGSTSNWYIGGLGTYMGIDGTPFDRLEMLIYGNGKNSSMSNNFYSIYNFFSWMMTIVSGKHRYKISSFY